MTTLGVGSGAAIAGLLGMNIKNFMEDWDYGFPFVTSLALGTSIIICGYSLTRLKRIQKLTLYGQYPGVKNRGTRLRPFGTFGKGGVSEDTEPLHESKRWKWRLWWWAWGRRSCEGKEEWERIKWWKGMWKLRGRYH